jgi:hypothetical protein
MTKYEKLKAQLKAMRSTRDEAQGRHRLERYIGVEYAPNEQHPFAYLMLRLCRPFSFPCFRLFLLQESRLNVLQPALLHVSF